ADDLPEEVKDPDRLWLALAAYNLGMGHMNGGRAIAESMGYDPNSWYEMKKVLPLLAKPEYYARLKSGRARGGEAVIMVENIRTFYDTLSRFEPAYKPLMHCRRPAPPSPARLFSCLPGRLDGVPDPVLAIAIGVARLGIADKIVERLAVQRPLLRAVVPRDHGIAGGGLAIRS